VTENQQTPSSPGSPTGLMSIKIPPRPALLMALQRETGKDDPNTHKIAQLISRDVAISGNLLATSNSAFFNLHRRATSVEDAIALIGLHHCKSILFGLITRQTLGKGAMMMARFWDVSEKRAMAMSYLAQKTRAAPPETAYSFGLFCDIGIPLLKSTFATYLETLSIANLAAAEHFLGVEDLRHGTNHALAGATLAEQWGIAPDVVDAIRLHHQPDTLCDEAIPATVRALVALNHVAERAIQEFRGQPESLEWIEGGRPATEALGYSEQDIVALCEAIKARFISPRQV
jgi:HD-like signal output (HDOD) protein